MRTMRFFSRGRDVVPGFASRANALSTRVSRRMMSTQTITVREAIREALDEEMERDDRVFIMGEEVAKYQGAYKITGPLWEKYGLDRVVDTPITESGFTGVGVGAAMAGLRPIVEFMTFNFATQAIDHITNTCAKTRYMSGGKISTPIVFRGPNGPPTGVGATHSQCYAAWYGAVPGLKVVAPWNSEDCKGLMKAAIRDDDPVVFLENELMYGQKFELTEAMKDKDFVVELGKAKVERQGSDVTIVSFARGVGLSLEAAAQLEKEDIDAEVINLRSIRPFDRNAILESLKKTGRLVSVEEGYPFCGIGSEIAALAVEEGFDYLDAPVERIASADVPMPYAANLEAEAMVKPSNIINAVKRVCA